MQNKGRFGHENLGERFKAFVGRRAFVCWTRTFIVLFVIIFVVIQFTFGTFFSMKDSNQTSRYNFDGKLIIISNDLQENNINEDEVPENKSTINIESALTLREKINQYNKKQNIRNEESYEPLSNDSLVIVVQVHNRIVYLKYLIESLSKAEKINETLLVFSHDVYNNDINILIQNITFCKVMQIFLPYSVELYPHEFPGNDPNDCPRDIGKKKALQKKCNGAEHPDMYNHYRESRFTQLKHHWWWKMNQVFSHLAVTKAYTGLVTFLEEDHYVAEDFIYLLKMMNQKCAEIVDCYFMGLGSQFITSYKNLKNANQVEMNPLISNLGLTFNRTTFNILWGCSKQFCEYDDYNWDWTLNYIAQNCGKMALRSMIITGPRVFHTGECGTHVHKKDCQENVLISKIKNVLNDAKDKLYPSEIRVSDPHKKSPTIKRNGGWGDRRDHGLCINMTER